MNFKNPAEVLRLSMPYATMTWVSWLMFVDPEKMLETLKIVADMQTLSKPHADSF
jgi:hypothetical protein